MKPDFEFNFKSLIIDCELLLKKQTILHCLKRLVWLYNVRKLIKSCMIQISNTWVILCCTVATTYLLESLITISAKIIGTFWKWEFPSYIQNCRGMFDYFKTQVLKQKSNQRVCTFTSILLSVTLLTIIKYLFILIGGVFLWGVVGGWRIFLSNRHDKATLPVNGKRTVPLFVTCTLFETIGKGQRTVGERGL